MAKTLSSRQTVVSDQSVAAEGSWTQTGSVDVSSITGYITFELHVKGSSVTLTDEVILKLLPSTDGTNFSDAKHGQPIAVINFAGTTYEKLVDFQNVTPFKNLKFYIENMDDTNAATVSLYYITAAV